MRFASLLSRKPVRRHISGCTHFHFRHLFVQSPSMPWLFPLFLSPSPFPSLCPSLSLYLSLSLSISLPSPLPLPLPLLITFFFHSLISNRIRAVGIGSKLRQMWDAKLWVEARPGCQRIVDWCLYWVNSLFSSLSLCFFLFLLIFKSS
jgi:hypothetical protein